MTKASHQEISYCAMHVFANDGSMDMGELHFLLGLALRDDQIDEDERKVLKRVFDRAESADLSEEVREKIQQVREKHKI